LVAAASRHHRELDHLERLHVKPSRIAPVDGGARQGTAVLIGRRYAPWESALAMLHDLAVGTVGLVAARRAAAAVVASGERTRPDDSTSHPWPSGPRAFAARLQAFDGGREMREKDLGVGRGTGAGEDVGT
jgi:hypothetical protein